MSYQLKKIYAKDFPTISVGQKASLMGFVANRRHHGNVLFLDIVDSTGSVQVIAERQKGEELFEAALRVPLESCIHVRGIVATTNDRLKELQCDEIDVISEATLQICPRPRSSFDIHDPKLTNQLLQYPHLYLRNPKIMAMMKIRSHTKKIIRDWFEANGFLEFDAPVLTTAPLYEDKTAIPVNFHGHNIFLTQCAGFYLEAGAQAFDKVYNMGVSFRGEKSKSHRHLIEYWHVKAEMLSGTRDDIIEMVEDLIVHITKGLDKEEVSKLFKAAGTNLCLDGLKTPYPQLTYEDAIKRLRAKGVAEAKFGDDISSVEADMLSRELGRPYWLVGIPRNIEPFPYCVDPNDTRVAMVADLIATNGCGEFVGVAEKIHSAEMLCERMQEKGKDADPRYRFVKEVHAAGCAPHIAFGMGFERLVRWITKTPHVRGAIPFPRSVGRAPGP